MKDAYSFDTDESGLDKNYKAMYNAYKRIFKRCGLDFLVTEADPGVMGGKVSHEFMVPAKDGEDIILACPKCKLAKVFTETGKQNCHKCNAQLEKINTVEVGHIFKLGIKYSSILGASFIDASGKQQPIIMGCYGIGVSRLISAIIEQNRDENGIIWPDEISPYKLAILPLDTTDRKIMEKAQDIYRELEDKYGMEVLFDDRNERAGVKFKDADLLGITLQIIIGRESLEKNTLELKIRRSHKKIIKRKAEILKEIKRLLKIVKC